MTAESIIGKMTRRVNVFYGWGFNCRQMCVPVTMAEFVLFNRPRSRLIDKPLSAASNVYEIEAFWNGYHNGTPELYDLTLKGDYYGQVHNQAHR